MNADAASGWRALPDRIDGELASVDARRRELKGLLATRLSDEERALAVKVGAGLDEEERAWRGLRIEVNRGASGRGVRERKLERAKRRARRIGERRGALEREIREAMGADDG